VGVSVGGLVAVGVALGAGRLCVLVGLAAVILACTATSVVGEAAAVMVTSPTSSALSQAASEMMIAVASSQANFVMDDIEPIVLCYCCPGYHRARVLQGSGQLKRDADELGLTLILKFFS
jgi:hypothetical protein